MSNLPIRLVSGCGRSHILTEEEINEMLFGADSDLDDGKTDDEEDYSDSWVPTADPPIEDTIENIDDIELEELLHEFDEAINSQTDDGNCNVIPEKREFVMIDTKNGTSVESEDVPIFQPNPENTEVVFEVMNESNIDGASAPKRARQTRSFVQRRKSPILSTSCLIPRTKKDVEKSAKGKKKSQCNGTRNQKSASTPSNKKNNYKSKPSKSQKSTPKASAKKKLKPKCLKSASAIAKDRMKSIKWKKGSLFYDVPFTKQIVYSDDLSSLRTPYEFFRYFFTNSLSQHICQQSVLYSIQNDPTKPLQMSTEYLDKFLGVLILHSVAPCKHFKMHWNPNVGNPVIRETITINRFEKLRQFLHFADNSQMKDRTDADFDKLFKLRPFIDAI